MNTPSLVWTPVYRILEERVKTGDELVLLIVPFIKLDALKQLLWVSQRHANLKIIVRWRPQDLIADVSDLTIYPFLRDRNVPLYLNDDIHLKLYVFESNLAFNTSGNVTLKGLGYSKSPNVEVGNLVALNDSDWREIYQLIERSRPVDDHVFAAYTHMLQGLEPPIQNLTSTPKLPSFQRKLFTTHSLPATNTPEQLYKYYSTQDRSDLTPEEQRCCVHDLVVFAVPDQLDHAEFHSHLSKAFRETPFVLELVSTIKQRQILRFGEVTAWIHAMCEDVPLPYRSELKENTRKLYDWLSFYYEEISWSIPGQRSQVLSWRGAEGPIS